MGTLGNGAGVEEEERLPLAFDLGTEEQPTRSRRAPVRSGSTGYAETGSGTRVDPVPSNASHYSYSNPSFVGDTRD